MNTSYTTDYRRDSREIYDGLLLFKDLFFMELEFKVGDKIHLVIPSIINTLGTIIETKGGNVQVQTSAGRFWTTMNMITKI